MEVSEPAFMLKLRGHEFFNEELSCLGWQLAEILKSIKEYTRTHDWYIFDVQGTSQISLHNLFTKNTQKLCIVHSTDELIDKVKRVIQFDSGVFMAFQKEGEIKWDFDDLPETEEREGLQHPLAEIEIRMFDYSYFEVYSNNLEVEKILVNRLGKTSSS